MNYTYHHLVDTTNDNRRKTELFNQGEKIKMDITRKQLNILSGEDTESTCFLECPYKDLFKSAVILMPSEVRRTFAEQWGEMEEVNDMVEEVEREENNTREPDTDEEEESEDEDEEEDDGTDQTDPTDYEELKAYLKTLTEEQRIKHRNFETLRNTANGYSPDYRMEKIYKAIKELNDEENAN